MSVQAHISDKGLYGGKGVEDNRHNICNLFSLGMHPQTLERITLHARSVACIVDEKALKVFEDGSARLADLRTLVNQGYLQEGERFAKEPAPGDSTAFLIAPKLMLTAAHCVCKEYTDEVDPDVVKSRYVLFDFAMQENGTCKVDFPKETVFKIQSVVTHHFSRGSIWADWAVIELNSEVTKREPLPLAFSAEIAKKTPVYMIGHPAGLPEKYTENALVKEISHPSYFETDLDAFSGNSGSPVFNAVTHKVVGILISGNTDFDKNGKTHPVTPEEIKLHGYERCQRIASCQAVEKLLKNEHT